MVKRQTNPVKKIAGKGKTPSLRNHINAMCAHCMGCTATHIETGFRDAVRACSAPQCPLHPVRPYQ